jgi:hypothetical protein
VFEKAGTLEVELKVGAMGAQSLGHANHH